MQVNSYSLTDCVKLVALACVWTFVNRFLEALQDDVYVWALHFDVSLNDLEIFCADYSSNF